MPALFEAYRGIDILLSSEEASHMPGGCDVLASFDFTEYCPDQEIASGRKPHPGIRAWCLFNVLKLGPAFLERWRKVHADLAAAEKEEAAFFESYTRSQEGSYTFMVVERMYEHLYHTHVPAPGTGAAAGAGAEAGATAGAAAGAGATAEAGAEAGDTDIPAQVRTILADASRHHSRRQALELSHLVFCRKLDVAEIRRDLRGRALLYLVETDRKGVQKAQKALADLIEAGKPAAVIALHKEDLEEYEEEHAEVVRMLTPVLKDTSYRWKWEVPMGL